MLTDLRPAMYGAVISEPSKKMKRNVVTKEQIILGDGSVLDFILDRSERKNIYLCIKDGQVILKLPLFESKEKAVGFLISKSDWIKKNMSNRPKQEHGFSAYEDGEKIKLLGKEYTLELLDSNKYFKPYFSDNKIIAAVNESSTKERLVLSINKLLAEFAADKVDDAFQRLCPKTGLYPKKISIKKMKSRWSSCSSSGNISINFDIIYQDEECLDYVVIHELCHLKHMNHSKDFWELVEKFCPERKRIRKKLNEMN